MNLLSVPVQLREGRLDVLDEQQRLLLDHQVHVLLGKQAQKGCLRRFCCLKLISEQNARPACSYVQTRA